MKPSSQELLTKSLLDLYIHFFLYHFFHFWLLFDAFYLNILGAHFRNTKRDVAT